MMGKLKSAIVPIILIGLAPLLVVVIIFGGAFVAIEEISNTKGIMEKRFEEKFERDSQRIEDEINRMFWGQIWKY